MVRGYALGPSRARTPSHMPRAAALCPLRAALPYVAARGRSLARCASSASSNASYFDVLGVSESASIDEIKTAFRAKSKLLHPDVNKETTAARDFMLLRRAYTTLSQAELRNEYEAKLGMPSARERDPRFARFERWRREVIPDLRVQLEVWSRGVDGFIAAWAASLEQREQTLARLHSACVLSLQQLQAAALAQPQQPPQPADAWLGTVRQAEEAPADWQFPDAFASMASSASADLLTPDALAVHQLAAAAAAAAGAGAGAAEAEALSACEESLRAMAVEVAGMGSDAGDGAVRVEREVEKRYQQVSVRYPAYPDIVWMDVWEETAEQWLAQSAAEALRCEQAAARWSVRLQQLRDQVHAAAPAHVHGQVAGAGTGRFNAE